MAQVATVSEGSDPRREAAWKLPARRTVSPVGSKMAQIDFATGMVNLTTLCSGCPHKQIPCEQYATVFTLYWKYVIRGQHEACLYLSISIPCNVRNFGQHRWVLQSAQHYQI